MVTEVEEGAVCVVVLGVVVVFKIGVILRMHPIAPRVWVPTNPKPVVSGEPEDTTPCDDCQFSTACSVIGPK